MIIISLLLLGALLALLGTLIIGLRLVLRGFAEVHKELRAVRTQFDTVIRLQNALRGERSAFETSARYSLGEDPTLQ